jgi:[DsrC]-trisulfide reductase subunit J
MYDKGKILIGLIIFIGLFTSPIWYDLLNGKTALKKPELTLPSKESQKLCVADSVFMRANHMVLLNDWRYEVVRKGKRAYMPDDHKSFDMSLTKTCLNCHSNASQFCDQCHSYVGVSPYCWDCHSEQLHPDGAELISKKTEIE